MKLAKNPTDFSRGSVKLWKLKGMLWRTYYWYFSNRFDEFNSLREVLSMPYENFSEGEDEKQD